MAKQPIKSRLAGSQGSNGHASASSAAPAELEAEQVDYSSWPIKELRRFLTERTQDPTGIVEKDDLVAKVGTLYSGCFLRFVVAFLSNFLPWTWHLRLASQLEICSACESNPYLLAFVILGASRLMKLIQVE